MAQIIDMEERRKPRRNPSGRADPPVGPLVLDPFAYIDQLVTPMAVMWQSWCATWGSLWLAPFGLQVVLVASPPPIEPKDRVGPRR